jgi:hypothetical protein
MDTDNSIVVHLYNGLSANGTGLHFHGIRQNFTNQMDGVPSITQCPTAPGEVGTPKLLSGIQLTNLVYYIHVESNSIWTYLVPQSFLTSSMGWGSWWHNNQRPSYCKLR